LYRHLRLATCTAITAFIGVISISGPVLFYQAMGFYQAIGRSTPAKSELSRPALVAATREATPTSELGKIETQVLASHAAAIPAELADNESEPVNTEPTAAPRAADNGPNSANNGEPTAPSPPQQIATSSQTGPQQHELSERSLLPGPSAAETRRSKQSLQHADERSAKAKTHSQRPKENSSPES
jgi:hypothetical protein